MAHAVFSLPVSIEQIAAAVKQMSPLERKRLFELVPELHYDFLGVTPRTPDEIEASIDHLRDELRQANAGQEPLSPETPFLGGLTVGEYFDLPEADRARVWEAHEGADWDEADEREVGPDALPAR